MIKKTPIIALLFLLGLMLSSTVSATTSLTYEYDADGNLIRGDGKYYEYNDANQLVRVKYGDSSGPLIAEYVYDYSGQRIKKVENGITTYYIGKHFEKRVDSAGTATNTSYYFANNERIAKKDPAGNMSYYHSDHLGGTNVITDSSGNLVERIRYYPFGEIREGGNEKYSFTGKEKDRQTDFYYFEARYYNPEFKHFSQADSVALNIYDPQDLNRYAYVRNNPIAYIDPTGHSLWSWFKNLFTELFSKKIEPQSPQSNNNTNSDPTSSGPESNKSTQPSYSSPLDNMRKGGHGFNEAGSNGVKYKGDGPGGVNDGMHNGIDLSASPDTEVKAPEHGYIENAEYKKDAGGYTVTFVGDSGNKYIFAHLKKNPNLNVDLAKGHVVVSRDEQIGQVGPNYGDEGSSGPHLHFGIKIDDKYINPATIYDINP
jgi:RHS repeat-associated protein